MEWKCDECLFGKPAADPQPVAAAPAHRPHQAPDRAEAKAFSSEVREGSRKEIVVKTNEKRCASSEVVRPHVAVWGRAGERGKPQAPPLPPPPSLTLPHKGGGNNSEPSIVVAKQNNALQIFALDDAAARLGLDVGLPLANARAICPEVTGVRCR